MPRLMLNDELWSKLREIMLQHRIYDKSNLRIIVEAMLYRMRVGCPWRDLPADFGCWNSIYQQFNRWSSKNKLMQIFKDLIQQPDLEWEFIDGVRHEVAKQTVAAESHLHATCCSVSSSLPKHAIGVIRWCEALGTMKPRETVGESARINRIC